MDLRQLRYFVQIVESGSLSKASRQLFIAQPALSTHMARLEEEVGRPLLVRSARGVVPTPNGDALYRHAKFLVRQFDEAVFVARQEYFDLKGRVTIGLAPETACMLGLPLLKHIREKYPGIVLNVVAVHSGYLEDLARSGQLDVAILFSKTAANELTFEPLLEEEVYVMLPRNSGILPESKASLTLAEAAALPLILPSTGYGLRRQIMLEFERANLQYEAVAEIDSLLLAMRYSAKGGGVTIQPMASTQAFDLPEGWRCLPISDARMMRTNYLYTLPIQKLSAGASVVRSELKNVVRNLVESGSWKGVRLIEEAAPRISAEDAGRRAV
ncbi:LysR substrate-binding domain-containing protein [Ramlibacter sp. 2FC]|uniref:LysR substrate-binding domain-containing protein n=1 Tax=Ramlibacter sp. 2FC TaxID=2502188 RepID=UPI0010F895EE|nr:LysR substrate-binding domain-containing protein [Ramlibacter sp. 2FC]